LFKQGGQPCRPVSAWQAVNSWAEERALSYAVTKWGDTKWIDTLAYAGYAALPDNWPTPQNLDQVFAGLTSNLKDHPAWRTAYQGLATRYGIPNVSLYEAGQHLVGDNPLFRAAQDDPRMGDVYRAIAAAAGDSLICWYCSPGRYDGSGSWGWGQSVDDDTVKRRVIFSMAGYTPTVPPVTPPVVVPPVQPHPPTSLPGNNGTDTLQGGGGNPAPGSGGASVTLASVTLKTPLGTFTIVPPAGVELTGVAQ
jgi:hypothetical protein